MKVYPFPPLDFVKRLQTLDPDLFLNWDPVNEHWSVWHRNRDYNRVDHVLNVIEPDGKFRPLDERTIEMIRANGFYAQHPDLLIKKLIDEPEEELKKSEKSQHDNVLHFAKDRTLQKEWDDTIERMRSMPWSAWNKEKVLEKVVDPKTGKLRVIKYKPLPDVMNSNKPTDGQAEELINATNKKDFERV